MQAAPPCILDLIPWGPSPPHHEDAFNLNPHIWSHLPENLLHAVLQWLPFRSVLRFRCVCKQWKALFASPAFHHFASHRAHVPPLIFFIGSSTSRDEGDACKHYDDGYDDNGYVYEDDKGYADDGGSDDDGSDDGMYDDNDGDSHDVNGSVYKDFDRGGNHCYDHLMGDGEHGDIHDAMRYAEHANVPDVLRYGDHEDMQDVMGYGDHGDMLDVMRYDDMHNVIGHGVIHDVDGRVNNQEAHEEHTNNEPLFLIFDCESESWRRPLALPPGFRRISRRSFLNRYHVCNFQEQVLIPTFSPDRLFLFNPASPPCNELPPCIAIQALEGFGFLEERTTPPGGVTSSNLSSLFSMSNEDEPRVQDRTAKILHVVAVGNTVNDTHIVESFNSVTGSWHVIGHLPPQSDDFAFEQIRMTYCKGGFFALLSGGILMISNILVGQNMEWNFQEFPDPPNRDDGLSGRYTYLIERRLVATRESVFLLGVTITHSQDTHQQEDWDILIWQFHPHAPADACWELHTYMPSRIWNTFFGGIYVETIGSLAHGDLIFIKVPGRRRFLIYDVPRKLWRFSAKCKYFLDTMTFVWEPLLRN